MKRMPSKGTSRQNKILRLMKLPIRALSRARDYYVRCMVECTQISRCPGAHGVGTLPRSFSMAGSAVVLDDHRSDDFRELVRAASVRTLQASCSRIRVIGRSASVGLMGMEKIDEDTGYEVDMNLDGETRKLMSIDGQDGGRKQNLVF